MHTRAALAALPKPQLIAIAEQAEAGMLAHRLRLRLPHPPGATGLLPSWLLIERVLNAQRFG